MSSPFPENRLARETSPYLLQHKNNPVDWYPWGEEAIQRARAENKPLLISIGYSACHWCHVMEHESFSNPDIAKVINEAVIPVKVDREERPDVDAIYMNACMAMSGQGGWPLNAFVTPDLKPFFAGTYFPPDDRYGRPGFTTVLSKIREAWLFDSAGLKQQAEALHQQLSQFSASAGAAQAVAHDLLADIVRDSESQFDGRFGGFGSAPKFPPDTRLAALLAAHSLMGSPKALSMVTDTLDAMAYGGIYDHIAGGFARYSVDAQWLIPHFEKMLYNQALLIPVYVDAAQVTGNKFYSDVARETANWVLEELTSEEGCFQCAYDADSEGEEGKFVVWTPEQVEAVLGPNEAKLVCEYYGITPGGNFEHGTSNPNVAVAPSEFAARHQMDEAACTERLQAARQKLRAARSTRVWPGLDDKCLTGWNGLMISALCRLNQVTGDTKYLTAAERCASVLVSNQFDGDHLLRVRKDGKSSVRGTLEDYAFFADSLIDLYETSGDERWLEKALELTDRMVALFHDATAGNFFFSDGTDAHLISRTKDTHDGALPSSNSVAVKVLLRLANFTRNERYTDVALRAITAEGRRVNSHPLAYASLVLAELYARPELIQVVLTGENAGALADLKMAVLQSYSPARVVAYAVGGQRPLPIAEDKPVGAQPEAYVCRNFTCTVPVSTVDELVKALGGA